MAYVKVYYRKDANELIKYGFEGLEPGDPVHGEDCPDEEEGAKKAFQAIRDLHHFKKGLQAVHVIQSWSPEVSQGLTREKVNLMGKQLAERYFKGHQFLVFTHSHDDHLHNHIVVNTLHMETGQRVTNKKKHLYKLREISNDICREQGVPNMFEEDAKRRQNMPDKAQRIERFNGNSYLFDMKVKANFARGYATSYDEYSGIMKEMGVNLRIKDKTITYYYQGRERGKRGDKMGKDYAHEGLEAAFKRNHEMFAKYPELRAQIRDEFARASRGAGSSLRNPGDLFLDGHGDQGRGSKDFKAYTGSSRAGGDRSHPGDDKLRNSIIPIAAIRRARDANLHEYCERHKIKLVTNDKGQTVLKNREHIVIKENQWVNTKNKTKGSAIEFAAIHGNMTYLQAIAKINGTPGLLDLEKHFGAVPRTFSSFHMPKVHLMTYPRAVERLARFLSSFGTDREMARPLLQSGQAEVRKSGVVRLFPQGNKRDPLEFSEDQDGKWTRSRRKRFDAPFFLSPGTGKKAVVFTDPMHLIEKRGKDAFAHRKRSDGILVLLEPDTAHVENYLKANPHVKELEIVTKNKSKPSQGELDFFGNLQTKLRGLGVNVKLTEFEKALMRRGPDLEL